MPEVLKFVTLLSKPLAIHPIQVHSFRKPAQLQKASFVSSVCSSGSWSFFQGREVKIIQTGNKTTVELPAQVSRMEQGKNPTDSKEMDKVEMDYFFTAL